MSRNRVALIALLLLLSLRAGAYIDITPTLGRIVNESRSIVLVRVEKVSREKRAIIYTKVADLKGELPMATVRHQLTDGDPPRAPRELLDWARPGQLAVLFVTRNMALTCVGERWYQTNVGTGEQWWRMTLDRPEIALAYSGPARRLADAVRGMLAGKTVVITTVAHGAQGRGSFSDVVFSSLQLGSPPAMQRLRAAITMPYAVYDINAQSPWFVGLGAVTAEDLSRLTKELESADAAQRIEAIDDLRLLGSAAAPAARAVEARLGDADPLVRLRAARALGAIDPKGVKAGAALLAGLADFAAPVRMEAARCIARWGKSAESVFPQLLVVLDKETDVEARVAEVEAIGAVGPAALHAVGRLVKLLDEPAARSCAAEAIGRIGPAATDALPALARLLESPDPETQWAATRAMVLIGGDGAKPVVKFLLPRLEQAPRGRELYQLTWLLGLLGPVADEAVPALEDACNRDRELASMAIWAIRPEDRFPWQLGYWADRDCDLWLFADYIERMGPKRTNGAALALVDAIANGRAGRVPSWGFYLVTARAEVTLPAITEITKHGTPAAQRRAGAMLEQLFKRSAPGAE